MRIIQLIQRPQRRGAEIFASQLSEELKEKGHELILVSIFFGDAELPFSGKKINLNRKSNTRFLDLKGWKIFSDLVKEFKPDLIQCNSGDTLKFAVFSKLIFGWNFRLIFRNANLISGFINSPLKRFFNQFLVNRIDGVASVSEICKNDFLKTFSFQREKIATITIGVGLLNRIPKIPDDINKFLKNAPFLIHIGSFVAEKNHRGLLRIFSQIQALYPSIKLILVGDGPLKTQIIQAPISQSLLKTNSLFFAGSRADALEILPFSNGLLLPSLIEGLPAVLLESMQAKVPVIAYAVGGIPEVILNGITGILVKKNDEKEFARLVDSLFLSKINKTEKIVDSAFTFVNQKFTLESVAFQFESFYKGFVKE